MCFAVKESLIIYSFKTFTWFKTQKFLGKQIFVNISLKEDLLFS